MRPVLSWILSLSVLAMVAGPRAARAQKSPPKDTPPQAAPAADAKHPTTSYDPSGILERASRFASGELGGSPLGLPDWEHLQKDLKLTPEQKEKLKRSTRSSASTGRSSSKAWPPPRPEDRRAKIAQLRTKARQNREDYKKKDRRRSLARATQPIGPDHPFAPRSALRPDRPAGGRRLEAQPRAEETNPSDRGIHRG